MDNSAACKVENTTHVTFPIVRPPDRVPGRSRNRIIDNGRPDEDEDEEMEGPSFADTSPAYNCGSFKNSQHIK